MGFKDGKTLIGEYVLKNTVIVGAQFGDEGKGKIIDLLSEETDVVVRFQGGNNAGHTICVGDQQYILHLVPSGVLHAGKICVIGNGVVVNPKALLEEIQMLENRHVSLKGRLFVSGLCHLIFPYHGLWDQYREESSGKESIGTTKKGIGPAYADKAARSGLRIIDGMHSDRFMHKFKKHAAYVNDVFTKIYKKPSFDVQKMADEYLALIQQIEPYVTDASILLNDLMDNGKTVLFEGAQGALLDIDFGTYPYVTSSSPTAGGACVGSGVGPTRIHEVIGVTKGYTTRVGEGPFPTEFSEDLEIFIREEGHEYGATTGRPRRCGWFDAVLVKHAMRINGITSLAITKLDVLSKLETIKICTAYKHKGKIFKEYPYDYRVFNECEPIYEILPGWRCDIQGAKEISDLPQNAINYLSFIKKFLKTEISIVSIGAKRNETIRLDKEVSYKL